MFIDQVNIEVVAGNGGKGMVALEEKYVPKGGPAEVMGQRCLLSLKAH